MPCIELNVPEPPALGLGLSITPPALPGFSGELDLCCKIVAFATPPIPLPLPAGTINVGVITALTTALAAVQAFLDALPLDCPLE